MEVTTERKWGEEMKFVTDTHAHTIVSGHAYSTMKEMAQAAKEAGLEVLALTEHAPTMPGTCGMFYFQNFSVVPRQMCGVELMLGAELNILDENGTVDLPESTIRNLDIVIASIHGPCYQTENTLEHNMQAYINAMKNPLIDIIGHPDDGRIPIDYEVLVKTAKETKTLLEVNNSSLNPKGFRQNTHANVCQMLKLCKQYEVPIVLGSDSHIDSAVGKFPLAEAVIRETEFPEELIVSTSAAKLKSFLRQY